MKKHLITLILFTTLILGGCVYIVWDTFLKPDETVKHKNLPEVSNYEIDMTHNVNAEGISQNRGTGTFTAMGDGPIDMETAQETIRAYAAEHGLSTAYYPDYLVNRMANNPELEYFVLNYPLGNKNASSEEISITRDISLANGNVPFFLQWDERWGYTTYGNDLMGLTGCGPTVLSMVAVYLTGSYDYNPLYMAEYAMENGYYDYENSSGTFWSLMTTGAENLGLTVNEVPGENEALIAALEAGHPVIAIMGPGDFTSEGHFIVITGYNNGSVSVNDPNSIIRSEKTWPINDVVEQANGLWEYSYND